MRFLIYLSILNLFTNIFAQTPWITTDFVWNIGFVSSSDCGKEKDPWSYFQKEQSLEFNSSMYSNIQSGDIVCVKCRFLPHFYKEILPKTEKPFVLLILDGDESFPSESGLNEKQTIDLLNDSKIIHLFAQNFDATILHSKITRIPIGIDFHTIAYKGRYGGWGEIGSPLDQEAFLKRLLRDFLPTESRIKKAYIDFHHSDSIRNGDKKRFLKLGEDRTKIFFRLTRTGLVEHGSWQRRSDLWRKKGQYAFSISPHGNGLDCHRTWEDLVLGCIVIVKTSPLDPLYEGLPVVIVQDWDEVNAENMDFWLLKYGDAFTNPEYRKRLTHQYWMEKIKNVAAPFKEKHE